MINLRTNLLLGSVIFLGGCVSWPPAGQGGMAEHRQEALDAEQALPMLGPEHGMLFDLELTRRHLDVLVLEGAELCFPATVVLAKRREDRITRELQGELEHDAINDLVVQRKLLAKLERRLDYVKHEGICVLSLVTDLQKTKTKPQQPEDISSRIYDLLNSDNQFAFDSADINPKYAIRLATAVQLLSKHSDLQLRITGHADALGEVAYNQALSLGRAMRVSRFLQLLGLSPDRIELDAAGSSKPLFDGTSPEDRLVNRRVSIELIEPTGFSKRAGE
jgi:outer membrane protein OmpA-like peptidoglycan-associated protein